MKRLPGTPIPKVELPDEFICTDYHPGDEKDWADILVSVGEFDSVEKALDCFRNDYLPHPEQLERRIQFIENAAHEKVATATCWWRNCSDQRSPSLEWVVVKPAFQGQGLGKAIVFKGMKRMVCLEGDNPVYLHTQTWSHRAIGIYQQAGFHFLTEGSFGGYPNEYTQAMKVLNGILKK